MALHGEIKVNNVVIGAWGAVRKEEVRPGTYRYECFYWMDGLDGHRYTAQFNLHHQYALGASWLARRVLSTGHREAAYARASQ